MTLTYKIEDLTTIDENLRGLYAEADGGGYVLQVEGVEPIEAVDNLKHVLQKERDWVRKYRNFGTPDEVAERLAALEELKQKPAKTDDAQKIVEQMKAKYEQDLENARSQVAQMQTRQTQAELEGALARAGFMPDALGIASLAAMQRIKFDNGEMRILAADGSGPMIGSAPDGSATISDLVKELTINLPYLMLDKGIGGSGKQPSAGGKPDKTMTRDQFDALDPPARTNFLRNGGKVA